MENQTNHGGYRKAIEDAEQEKQELIAKLKDLETIQQRLSRLEIFIEQGKFLLGIEAQETPKPLIPPAKTKAEELLSLINEGKKPIHLRAMELMQEIGRPMEIEEIEEEFRKRNWKLSPNHGAEVLRRCFRGRPNVFSKNKKGLYSLKIQVAELSSDMR